MQGTFIHLLIDIAFIPALYLLYCIHISTSIFLNFALSMQKRLTPLKILVPSAQDISTSTKQPAIEEKTVKELLDLDLFDYEVSYLCSCVKLLTVYVHTSHA